MLCIMLCVTLPWKIREVENYVTCSNWSTQVKVDWPQGPLISIKTPGNSCNYCAHFIEDETAGQ